MKFTSIENVGQLNANLSVEAVLAHTKFMKQTGRIAFYVWPIASMLWIYIVFPDIGLSTEKSAIYELIFIPFFVFLAIGLHELVHLIALPHKIFHKDTCLVLNKGTSFLHMNLAIKWGGTMSRNQFIWSSLLPFILLSVIPYLTAIFLMQKPSLAIGMAAAANVSFSVTDIAQAILLLKYVPANQTLGEQ